MTDTEGAEGRSGENVAAGWFMVALGMALGGAGILIAALAVGTERAWRGRSDNITGEGWRQSAADHRVWLDRDRAAQRRWRAARRAWWRSGADPATEPARPPTAQRAGTAAHRWWARLFLSADRIHNAGRRFGEGWREGWAAAKAARRDGAGWVDTARTRPAVPQAADGQGNAATPEPEPAGPPAATKPSGPAERPAPTTPSAGPDAPTADGPAGNADPVPPVAGPDPEGDIVADVTRLPQPHIDAYYGNRPPTPSEQLTGTSRVPFDRQPVGWDPHITTAQTPNQQGDATVTAPTGETHLDLTAAGLRSINARLTRIAELNDALAAERAALAAEVTTENERVTANGGTAATTQAFDEANAVVDILGKHIASAADATASASDQTSAAEQGLAPARDAQDTLHSAGARGEYVSAAASD